MSRACPRITEGTDVRRVSFRHQRTLARPAEVCGTGFLAGAPVRLRFLPAPPSSGVVFVRTDLEPVTSIPATIAQVTGTNRRTTLGHAPAQVTLVEHVLAAVAGLRIDNCVIEIDGIEPPGLDGSARAFVDALLHAGIVGQPAERVVWSVDASVVVAHGGATLALHPATDASLRITYLLNYGVISPIARQSHTVMLTPATFASELADSRTFLLEAEAHQLRQQGIGLKTSVSDLLVIGPRGPIANRTRHGNELARHKVLDIVGDLSLFGHDLAGHIVAYRSGHPLNSELTRTLTAHLAPSAAGERHAA